MKYVIRFSINETRRPEMGARFTYGINHAGSLKLGSAVEDSKLGLKPHRAAKATRFDSYEAAAEALLKWAQRVAGSGSMWVRSPAIVEVPQ